ncbi:ABC transporter permease [Ammoniphilus sp. YIM 78166]|uniref:ABC transporter permease n=1 Tax=Ammoniphilus sp. YIM 78166 TaxID=1644106 RepID=UPI00143033BB|nr:ABC transporter permease [Ammoniphilus sp. YIM 78166]
MLKKVWEKIVSYQVIIWLVLIWEIIVWSGVMPERLFPSLFKVVYVSYDLLVTGMVGENLSVTLFRLFAGFGLAALVGVPLGLMMSRYNLLNDWMQPMFSIGYPIPRVALYPIFVFIFGIGSGSKILVVFLECIFPIVINTYYGSLRVNHLYVWAAQNMGASQMQLFWKVLFPATLPSIFTGFRIAIPLALVITILTEMIGSTDGMGYLLSYMSASLMQEKVMAGVIFITILGFMVTVLFEAVHRRFVFWK